MPTDTEVRTSLDTLKALDSLTFLRWLMKVEPSDSEKSCLYHAGLIDCVGNNTDFGNTIVAALTIIVNRHD